MNERGRQNDRDRLPDTRAPGQDTRYFPSTSYQTGAPQAQGFVSIEDAVAQITARQRALEADPYARPAPMAPPPPSPQPSAPGPDLSRLEDQLRAITAQIETLRQPADFGPVLRELRQDLAEISNKLVEAMPRRAVEALEAEVRRLGERIDMGRAAGIDPDTLSGMERGLSEVRDALRNLKPAESLVGFEQAIRNLSERIDQSGTAYQDPASLQQIETAIVALRGIVANVASNETLSNLAEEVRSLSAKIDKVAASSRGLDPDMMQALEQSIAKLPILGAIERGFADLNARLDGMQQQRPAQPDGGPEVDYLKRDLGRTQDSLEAVHSTLGHLVDRLAMIEGGIREARLATEPRNTFPPTGPRNDTPPPAPSGPPGAPRPGSQKQADTAPAYVPPQSTPSRNDGGNEKAEDETDAAATPARSPLADLQRVAAELAITPPIGSPPPPKQDKAARPEPVPSAPRERRTGESHLPPDYPLEPGSGIPRAKPVTSAAERIAASEAALGAAKPGGANHPGQTDFIAAARRAAQAAAAMAPEPQADQPAEDDEAASRSISNRMRKLFAGAGILLLIVAGGRLALEFVDFGSGSGPDSVATQFIADDDETQTAETEDDAQQNAAAASQPAIFPVPQPSFNAMPSGVIFPDSGRAAPAAPETTGSVPSRHAVPVQSDRGPLPPMPEKLPTALRNAAAKGQPAAEFEVGMRLLDGKAGPQNTGDGIAWLERAAKSGIVPAHFRLGGIYEKGLGVRKDLSAARSHYIAAAERGHAKAMHNLAVLYAEGIDGKPDYNNAATWFRRAAARGIADSQFNLGILFARGIGVDQNLAESYKWFALAAIQGDRDAAKKRDEVGARLDKGTLTSVRNAVQTFIPEPQPDDALTVATPPGGWDAAPAGNAAPAKKPRTGQAARVTAS